MLYSLVCYTLFRYSARVIQLSSVLMWWMGVSELELQSLLLKLMKQLKSEQSTLLVKCNHIMWVEITNGSISIEQNHKSVDLVKKGQSGAGIAIKIEGATQQLFGRHIDEKETLYSHITRHSIDTLKLPAMRDEVTKEEWTLIIKLKTVFRLQNLC
jgi:hypothetical protein